MTFDEFLKAVGPWLELDWRKYRRRSARRRTSERLAQLGLTDFSQYLERLRIDSAEARRLPDLMHVTVSRLFREQACWWELGEKVLPVLLEQSEAAAMPLRAWSAGCCNGEEAYSLAALALWRFNSEIEILATDIDETVLERAHEGCYQESELREVPNDIMELYLLRSHDKFCIDSRVKKLVSLRSHNLQEHQPPQGMDLVMCRYLAFTYYCGERRYRACRKLWQALRPSGALMIGRKEKLGRHEEELFERWPGASCVFRRKEA